LHIVLYRDTKLRDIAEDIPLQDAACQPGSVAAMYSRIPRTG